MQKQLYLRNNNYDMTGQYRLAPCIYRASREVGLSTVQQLKCCVEITLGMVTTIVSYVFYHIFWYIGHSIAGKAYTTIDNAS